MTNTQKKFFHKPRTMGEVWKELFKGDAWEANQFQNENISKGLLETCLIDNPLGKEFNKIIALRLKQP